MTISCVTTDFECDSANDLSRLAKELAENVIIHLNGQVDDFYRVALGLGLTEPTPNEAVSFYCSLIEKTKRRIKARKACSRRVVDIAFESRTEPASQCH